MRIRIINYDSCEIKEIGCDNIQYAFEVYRFAREAQGYNEEDLLVEIIDEDGEILYSGYEMVECVHCGEKVKRIETGAFVEDEGYYCTRCYVAICEDKQDYLLH